MNRWRKHDGLITLLAFFCALVPQLSAQTFTTLHSFPAPGSEIYGDVVVLTNSDGIQPSAGLVVSGITLYGTTPNGGNSGGGTVFRVNIDGSGFSTLHSFLGSTDGFGPLAGLVISSNLLYGTAPSGGSSRNGSVFSLGTDGTGFTTLHHFTESITVSGAYSNSDGVAPKAELVLVGHTLFGTTALGGSNGFGTVFAVTTDGSVFKTLHSFTGGDDGAAPHAGLISSGNVLYGTAQTGGSMGSGTVFAINTDGTSFRTLYSFNGGTDGANPAARLTLLDNTLYGAAFYGGSSGYGTVFKLSTAGTGFTTLLDFSASLNSIGIPTNGVGFWPNSLVLSGNTLYGTATAGGSWNSGTLFSLSTEGTAFTNLYSFTGGNDGNSPEAGLILFGQTLFGTAVGNWGTVFSLSFSPQLTIHSSGENVTLTWPTNYAGFDYTGFRLQSATNLATPIWTTDLSTPAVVNGRNVVTNPISGTQFFRLSQ